MVKIFLSDHNNILEDVAKEFELVKIGEAERVVLWNDVDPLNKSVVKLANSLKIPTITVQHGRRGTSRYYPPFNFKILADRYCCWGERDKEDLIQAGQDPKKIFVTGTTLFQHLKGRKEHKEVNIVFSPEHWDKEIGENLLTAKELRKLKVKITTKIIDGHDKKLYDNPVYSDRRKQGHLSVCAEVLETADLVVGISESTFELFAQYLDIPVVIMAEWKPKTSLGDERYLTYRRVISEASKKATIKNLVEVIKQQLENPDELKEERKKVCIEEGGVELNALENIVRVIHGKA